MKPNTKEETIEDELRDLSLARSHPIHQSDTVQYSRIVESQSQIL